MKRAFSLLEMMVAIALLSMGLVLLLQVQARSIQLAQQAREMTIATQLARAQALRLRTGPSQEGLLDRRLRRGRQLRRRGDARLLLGVPRVQARHAGRRRVRHQRRPAGEAAGLGDTAAAADGAADPMMGMLAPILSQMSGILGDSIRELHVIIRWGTGEDMQEMTVTTHVIDKTAVNNVAGVISAKRARSMRSRAAADWRRRRRGW